MTHDSDNSPLSTRIAEVLVQTNPSIRPRWYFVLLGALMTTGALLLVCLTLFLMSFIFFILNTESITFVPTFGIAGALAIIFSLPWIIILLVITFVVILELFLRHISFVYRRPLIYSLAAVSIITVFGGLLVARTTLHETLMEHAAVSSIPLMKPLYTHYSNKPPSNKLTWGRIANTTTDGFVLEHPKRPPLFIIVTEQTQLTPNTQLTPGAIVSVFGPQQGDTIHAKGIRDLPQKREQKFKMK